MAHGHVPLHCHPGVFHSSGPHYKGRLTLLPDSALRSGPTVESRADPGPMRTASRYKSLQGGARRQVPTIPSAAEPMVPLYISGWPAVERTSSPAHVIAMGRAKPSRDREGAEERRDSTTPRSAS